MHKRLSLEMGGKNAQIVLDDADLDLALDGVLWGAFGTTGQRCTATSRLILQDGIHDEFAQPARGAGARAAARRRPAARARMWGRSSTQASREKVERYIDIGQAEGADLLVRRQRAPRAGRSRTATSSSRRSSPA